MRNLGLALVFAALALAPHDAMAKKGRKHPKPRALKMMKKPAKRAAHRGPVRIRDDDALATAVVERKRSEPAQLTAVVPSPAPVEANAPVNMSNQVLDDEVPGTKKKR